MSRLFWLTKSIPSVCSIQVVKDIVKLCLIHTIASEDIGVIAPYSAQCRKIRQSLKAVAGSVKVGSVEEFQGQVRRHNPVITL